MQAWLSLTPEGSELSHGELYGPGLLPSLEVRVAHLPGLLVEAGTVSTGMGSVRALSYGELHHYMQLTGSALSVFEVQCLRAMSAAVAQLVNQKEPPCPGEDQQKIRARMDQVHLQSWIRMARAGNG